MASAEDKLAEFTAAVTAARSAERGLFVLLFDEQSGLKQHWPEDVRQEANRVRHSLPFRIQEAARPIATCWMIASRPTAKLTSAHSIATILRRLDFSEAITHSDQSTGLLRVMRRPHGPTSLSLQEIFKMTKTTSFDDRCHTGDGG